MKTTTLSARRERRVARWAAAVAVTMVASGLVQGAPAGAAEPAAPGVVNVEPPEVTGTPELGEVLKADPGTWDPEEATLSYRWLRDGDKVKGADERRYRPVLKDVGHDLSVRVVATWTEGDTESRAAEDSEPVTVRKGTFSNDGRPKLTGKRRFGHVLFAKHGSWTRTPDRFRYQWLRNGKPIKGATGRRHLLNVQDFDKRLSVRVTARKAGYKKAVRTSRKTVKVMHRAPARHTVTYHVETRGKIVTSLKVFKAQAQQTFNDPRGWRGSGVAFRRVAKGGSFTLVLSEASRVPSFSSGCSAQWSCRVGRYVVINQLRWRKATPMWHSVKKPLRGYRHMVVNHETGHWLGWGHRSCPKGGALAPVMQQQSKDLAGCKANPWPTAGERNVPRF